jgi:DNA-binding transcriptional regulator LsrR (DeoR family)
MENLLHIEDLIPFGRNNAVKRADLVNILGMSDRVVRKMIEDARQSGIVIINMQIAKRENGTIANLKQNVT